MNVNKIIAGFSGAISATIVSNLYETVIAAKAIILPCLLFISIDFILGICTNIKSDIIKKEKFGIQSKKMWNTCIKLLCTSIAIWLCVLYDNNYLDWLGINLGTIFGGIISGVEFISIMGHLCYLSNWGIFNIPREILQKEIENKVGHKIEIKDE